MKSIFTKLSTLLLCGAVAMVSCTDFSEDIQNLDNKVDNLGNTTQTELATLQKAITDLEAKLSAQYATKDEVAALKTTLENSIATEVAALSEDIAEVSAALNAAKNEINTAIAGLDEKKADKAAVEAAVKTATEAIAALQAELEAAKGDLEAEIASVKEQIAATQESLQEQINGVDAKANELQNTLLSLGDYLKTLEAKVNEINNTLLSLGEYLPTIEAKILEVKGTVESLGAEYEANKEVVDAKLTELFSTLVSLSNHLEEYEATTDFKLVELQGSLAALSTYLEEYEASVDAKFDEILNTFESLSLFLDEKFAALEATDTDLYTEIEGIRVVLSALNNLLTDETAARESEDAALYELIGSSVTALNNLIADLAAEDEAIYAELDGVRQAFTTLNNLLSDEAATREAEDAAIYELIGSSVTALNNLIADLEAEDEAIYAEIENVRTYVAQVYNALSTEIAAVDAALQAHIAAFEAFKEAYEAKVDELEATDENLYVEINGLREVITTINNHIDDLRAEDEAIYLEINGLRENLTQLQNAINNRIDEEVKTLKDEILEKFNILNTVILETEKRVNDKFNHTLKLIAENTELILANAAAIADLEAAVEMLMDWVAGQEENNELQAELIAKVYEIVGEMEEQIAALTQKDNELEGLIGKTAGALQTYMDENDARLADLELFINENINSLGAGIRNLEAIINDLEARFGARLDALEERMDAAEGKIADLEDQAAAMAKAIENIEAAIEDLKAMDEALAAEIANVDAAAKAELKKARKELQDQIDALVEAKEDLQVRVAVLEELVADNTANIENNRKEIEANITAISNAVKQLGSLQATVNAMIQSSAIIDSALQAKDIELQKNIDAAVADLAAAVARIGAVEDAVKALQELAETLATKAELKDEVAKIEKKMTEIQNMLLTLITASEDRANDKIEHLRGLVADANELIAGLRGDVDNLLARVQSLVYVPDYSDHKAVIDWAGVEITNRQVDYQCTIIAKESVLRYRVYAKAGESAAEAAKDIAEAWATNNDILSYEVEPVKKVWMTRSADVPAGLEVRNVVVNEENPEIIDVTVLAKNFIQEFFIENMEKYVADGELTEDEYQRPEKTSYSAAIVLSDGNNNRSSEYTNLVPGEPEIFGVAVADGAKQKDISFTTNSEAPRQLPYDLDNPDSVILLEDHSLVFIKSGSEDGLYTPKAFMDLGYDLQLERRQHFSYHEDVVDTDYRVDGKDQALPIDVADIKFLIHERDYVSELEEGNTYVTLTEPLTREQYLALEDKDLDIKFLYLVNGIEVWAQSTVEICNRLVEVNFSVDVPWTLETAVKTNNCTEDLTVPYTYDLAKAVKNNKSLEGYSLSAILKNVKSGDKHNGGHYDIALKNITADTFDVRLQSGSDKYAFPVNNEDSIKDYNTYSVSFISRFEDIDVTINLNMNLGELAPVQKLSKEVKFTTAGENGWLYAYWNAIEDAYQKFLADGYIGYVDAPETGKAMFRAAFGDKTAYTLPPMLGVKADKVGHESNTNVPFTEFNNEAGEHMFKVSLGQLQADENGLVDGTTQTITQNFVHCYGMIPFVFTVNGTVDLPEYALDLDPVRAPNGHVDVYGEIKGEVGNGGVYTVDVSDLAKYYYVVNKAGVKDLKKGNEGDVVTVKFDLVSMAEGESGFEFEGESGVVTNTLTVNFDKEEPYILPMGDAVATWGTYDHTHLGVVATLYVNGFKIGTKDIVLETKDPLDITFKDVNVTLSQKHGTNAEPTVAKIFSNFELTSTAEPNVENLFNTEAWTIAGIFKESQANVTYGAEIHAEFMRVYYINERGKAESWDKSKIQLGKVTADKLAAAPWLTEGEFDGTISISADDGNVQTPIYVDVLVKMNHRIHAEGGPCEKEGIVTVKFIPEGYEE